MEQREQKASLLALCRVVTEEDKSQPMEQREQKASLLALCRVVTEEDKSQPMEQREQKASLLALCRVVTEEDKSQGMEQRHPQLLLTKLAGPGGHVPKGHNFLLTAYKQAKRSAVRGWLSSLSPTGSPQGCSLTQQLRRERSVNMEPGTCNLEFGMPQASRAERRERSGNLELPQAFWNLELPQAFWNLDLPTATLNSQLSTLNKYQL